MKKLDKKCSYCNQNTLVPFDEVGGDWLKCSNCGATHLPNPTSPGTKTLFVKKLGKGKGDTKYRPRKHRVNKKLAPAQ